MGDNRISMEYTYEQARDYVHKNGHRYTSEQRRMLIAQCYPGFLYLMQLEQEAEMKKELPIWIPKRT